MTGEQFIHTLRRVYGDVAWPKPLHLLRGRELINVGIPLPEAAKEVRTTPRALAQFIERPNPLTALLGHDPSEVSEQHLRKARQQLGQLLLGRCAEMVFEDAYRREMETDELTLKDLREERSATDYRLYNGKGKAVYRLNIKFHGSQFRRAAELVGLQPDDCFALATYKIHSALRAQEQEALPYLFAIVGVPNLTGEDVGAEFPSAVTELVAHALQSKSIGARDIEDAAVSMAVREQLDVFRSTLAQIQAADWYVLSATRALKLLREKLFDRVFALRVRNFAQQFRRAELDMHFSLSSDLIPLPKFFQTLREGGLTQVTTLIGRGDY